MPHAFISYSQEDRDFATVMKTKLETAGFDVWVDEHRLRPGVDWSEEIDRGILAAFALILVMSPASSDSEYVTYEWSFALGAKVPVVPVLLRKVEMHPRLLRMQYLDFSGKDRPWDALINELKIASSAKATQWSPPRDVPPHLQPAVGDLDSGNAGNRLGAVEVLADSTDLAARDVLRRALAHPFRDVRGRTAVRLGELKDEAIISETGLRALTDALAFPTRDKEDDTRFKATGILRELGSVAFPVLESVSKTVDDPARVAAAELLSSTGGDQAVPTLVALLADSNTNIVLAAIKQVGQLRARVAVDELLKLMQKEDLPGRRYGPEPHGLIARALIDIGDDSIMPRLVAAAEQPSPVVRMCAAQVLGELCGAPAIPVLKKLLSDDVTAYYMSQRKGGGAVGGTHSVGYIAALALDQIGTPEAVSLAREYRETHPVAKGGWATRTSGRQGNSA